MKLKTFSLIFVLLISLFSGELLAQNGGIEGFVVHRISRNPIKDVKVSLQGSVNKVKYTALDGKFNFTLLEDGVYKITLEAAYMLSTELNVTVKSGVYNLGSVSMSPDIVTGDLDEASFVEFDTDGSGSSQNMPVLLSATKDVYENIAGYKFGIMRFKNRGLESGSNEVYLNGIKFNDAINGYTPWSLWSGLNDATRNQEITSTMGVSDWGVGGINGLTNINASASKMRKGFRAGAVNASGQYRFRLMATYASGVNDKGWSYGFSVSSRLGGNDWVTGVSYNSLSYFASVEKNFKDKHNLAFTIFGAPTVRGVQAAATQETFDLVGNNYYNSNWGYMNGTSNGNVRNARVKNYHEPVAMLKYDFTPNKSWLVTAALAYRFGKNGYSALDWYDAQDPRPDYYRNLPSYYSEDPLKAAYVREGWLSDWNVRQINWQRLYDVNSKSFFEGSNLGNNIGEGTKRAKYVIEQRRTDQNDKNAKLQFTKVFRNYFKLSGGYEYRWNKTENYKIINDLLGGDYWLDVDQFAERDFGVGDIIQNDLNNPNRLVAKGDKYGYDYYANVRNNKLWALLNLNIGSIEAYVAAEGGNTKFWREGLYRKGLFPNNSYGESEKKDFYTYKAKVGLSYKIDGANVISANVASLTNAPFFQESFISPRTRNSLVPHLTTEKTFSVDLNYNLKTNYINLRLSGYYTTVKDQTKLISAYDDISRTFTNLSLRGIDQRNIGLELGVQVPIYKGLSASAALSYGDYIYTSNPLLIQTKDNSEQILVNNEKVYWKNFRVGATPQTAINFGLNYKSDSYWFIGIDANYFDAMYIDMNPLYRIDAAHVGLSKEQSIEMASQEKFDSAFVLNANVGKSWYINRKYNLGFSLEIKNILNNTNIKTGGYEQMRLKANKDANGSVVNYTRFDSKYFYLFGANYYLNIYFRF